MTLNSRQIEVIHAVAHTGSVTDAAALLDVSQPAVSMTLRECSKVTGFPLFEHRRGRMQPTSETLVIIPEVEKILRTMHHIDQLVSDLRTSSIGHVRLAVAPALGESLLPSTIAAFKRDRIQLSVLANGSEDVAATIDEGRADLGLVLSASRSTYDIAIDLGATELVCLLHRDHPLANRPFLLAQDIVRHPLVTFRNDPLAGVLRVLFVNEANGCDVAFEVSDGSTLCSIVQQNLGIAIVPTTGLPQHRPPDVLERELRPRSTVFVQLLRPAHRHISRAAHRLEAALRIAARNTLLPISAAQAVDS